MTRTEILQKIINRLDAKEYLEIGVADGDNFMEIKVPFKTGVDPIPADQRLHVLGDDEAEYHQMHSDEFFQKNEKKFDVIFIDGLHRSDQVIRDVLHGMNALNKGGVLVMHNCNPPTEGHQTPQPSMSEWTGDVWKAVVHLRTLENIDLFVVDVDFGCGIVRKGRSF